MRSRATKVRSARVRSLIRASLNRGDPRMYETDTETRERLAAEEEDFRFPADERPGRVSVLSAALHYPFLVVLPILLLVGAGAFLGLHRKPNYTAQVRLQVASIDPNAP